MSIYTYSLSNKTRDLSGVMHTVVAEKGGFISEFKEAPPSTNHKHEWLQDKIAGRGFKISSFSAGKGTLSDADFAKVKIGTRFRVKGYPVIFVVSGIDTGNKITATVHAANGNTTKTAIAASDECVIVSAPVKEGSRPGDGDTVGRKVGTAYNFTQIIRKDIRVTGSALKTLTYDQVENDISRQTEHGHNEAERDMNRCAIWGVRTERTSDETEDGEAGGLYAFATMAIDAKGAALSSKLINDAVDLIMAEGGEPNKLYCSPKQARVLANEFKNNLTVLRDDNKRGTYVAVVINESTGNNITIFGDPDFEDNDAFLADDQCFGLSWMRPMSDSDSSLPGEDAISRTILGEFTLEFRNAAQRLCKITGLKNPADALNAIEESQHNVQITAGTITINQAGGGA